MRTVTFAKVGFIGGRRYSVGESVELPEAYVRVLLKSGAAVLPPSPASPDPAPDSEPETQPATSLSKRALKKLLRRKV